MMHLVHKEEEHAEGEQQSSGEADPMGTPEGITGEEARGGSGMESNQSPRMEDRPMSEEQGGRSPTGEEAELAREDEEGEDEPMASGAAGEEAEQPEGPDDAASIGKQGGGAGMQAPPEDRADAPRGEVQVLAKGEQGLQPEQREQPQQGAHMLGSPNEVNEEDEYHDQATNEEDEYHDQATNEEDAKVVVVPQPGEGGEEQQTAEGHDDVEKAAAESEHTNGPGGMGSSGGVGQMEPEGQRLEAGQEHMNGMDTMANGQAQSKQSPGTGEGQKDVVLTLMKATGGVMGGPAGQKQGEQGMGAQGQKQDTHETAETGAGY
jgi:hypothetical protein